MSFLNIFRNAGKKRGKYLEKRRKVPALCTGILVPAILKKVYKVHSERIVNDWFLFLFSLFEPV